MYECVCVVCARVCCVCVGCVRAHVMSCVRVLCVCTCVVCVCVCVCVTEVTDKNAGPVHLQYTHHMGPLVNVINSVGVVNVINHTPVAAIT